MADKRTTVKFDVFGYAFTVIKTESVQRTANRLGGHVPGAFAQFMTKEGRPIHGYLVFATDPDPGHVAHEASHAVWYMLKGAGAELDDETFAYHLQHLVAHIHKFMNRE